MRCIVNDLKLNIEIANAVGLTPNDNAAINYCDDWNLLMPLLIEYDVAFLVDKDATARQGAECLLKALQDNH